MSKFFGSWHAILLLMLGLIFVDVAAAAIPKVAGYRIEYGGSVSPVYSSWEAACGDPLAQRLAKGYDAFGWYTNHRAVFVPPGSSQSCKVYGDDSSGVQKFLGVIPIVESGSICPANSTTSGSSCTCKSGFEEKDGQCVPENTCKFGDTSSAGYYDAGKNTAGGPAIMVCTGGCESIFDGSFPEGSALVNGEKHYYAKGEYIKTGRQCTGSAETVGQGIPVAEIPPDSCGEGQVMGKVNGKSVCSKSGADGSPSTKPEDKKDQSSSSKTTTKDKDEEGNDRETTTTTKKNADGSTTTEKTVTVTKSNGNGGTTTTTTTSTSTTGGVPGSGGKGESGGKEDGKDDGDKEKGKCEKNSSDEGCGGAAANVDGKSLYNAKEKTFSDVLSKASTDLKGSGIGGAFTGFFNVASGGACPVSNWHIPYINADLTFDFMCQSFALDAMLIIKGVLLVIASFMAFRIAFE